MGKKMHYFVSDHSGRSNYPFEVQFSDAKGKRAVVCVFKNKKEAEAYADLKNEDLDWAESAERKNFESKWVEDAKKKKTEIPELGNYSGNLHIMKHGEKFYVMVAGLETVFQKLDEWTEISRNAYETLKKVGEILGGKRDLEDLRTKLNEPTQRETFEKEYQCKPEPDKKKNDTKPTPRP